jgi:hypothetical protein
VVYRARDSRLNREVAVLADDLAADPEMASRFEQEARAGAPVEIPAENPRVPAWSPVADQIAYVGVLENQPVVHVVSPDGRAVRRPLPIEPVGVPTAMAWSPDGLRLALVNLPGRAAAEAWVLDVSTGRLRKVADVPAPAEFEGVSWAPDGRWLVLGRSEYDAEVLLLELATP